jgi:cytochrome P450
MLRPQFARDQVADLEIEEEHIQDLMQHLPTGSSGWTDTINLSPIFFRMTLDSATEFLFGESVGSQIAALPRNADARRKASQNGALDWTTFAPAFDGATDAIGKRARFADLYWIYNPKSFRDNCSEIHRFTDHYVNIALNPDQKSEKDIETGRKKVKYVFLHELVKATRDPVELRSQLLNILLAGRDTTAGLLGWTFYLLARHPHIFNKLRDEIVDRFGTYKNPRDITFASLKSCSYLQYVMSETLRLYPTVPFNHRRATKDTSLPLGGGPDQKSPVYVRKGQEVNYSVHIMHHRKDIWGPDVEEFKPERWAGRKTGWEFLPFNGGPRICLGQQHALTTAGFTIVRMLQRFDKLENMDQDPVARAFYTVTTSPLQVDLRLHEAAE